MIKGVPLPLDARDPRIQAAALDRQGLGNGGRVVQAPADLVQRHVDAAQQRNPPGRARAVGEYHR